MRKRTENAPSTPCGRCGRQLTIASHPWSTGFAGYCRPCELEMCMAEGLPESIVQLA